MLNALTIDVEDYFQTEAMSSAVTRAEWGKMELRVEQSMWKLLALLDQQKVHATLFFLGWIAERCPRLVAAAAAMGHEIGCHSYWHHPVFRQAPDEFRDDTLRAKNAIESITSHRVIGYRAPNFSILQGMEWANEILCDLGFVYSSSSHPIHHDLYGNPSASRTPYRTPSGLWEIPITTCPLFGKNLPVGGGAYLRMLPTPYVMGGLQRAANFGQPMVIYLHPWEIDPDQPRLRVTWKSRLRQYTGLDGMEDRLERLISKYNFGAIAEAFGGMEAAYEFAGVNAAAELQAIHV